VHFCKVKMEMPCRCDISCDTRARSTRTSEVTFSIARITEQGSTATFRRVRVNGIPDALRIKHSISLVSREMLGVAGRQAPFFQNFARPEILVDSFPHVCRGILIGVASRKFLSSLGFCPSLSLSLSLSLLGVALDRGEEDSRRNNTFARR